MRAGVLFASLVVSTVLSATPTSAKPSIAEATIAGPGIEGEMRIGRRHTMSLWEHGIDTGGVDDSRADSVDALGLTPSDLGARYLVAYRFDPELRDDPIRQDLYPFAEGGPVTYTPPHQKLMGLFGDHGYLRVTPGWYRSSPGFLGYLVNRGLPARDPLAPVATGGADADTAPGALTGPWTTVVVVVLVGLTALSLATPSVRRRVLALGRLKR